MRNILALLAAVVLIVGGVGWYRGWYQVKTSPAPEGHREILINVNQPKIVQDLDQGKNKVREVLAKKNEPSSIPPPLPSLPSIPVDQLPSPPEVEQTNFVPPLPFDEIPQPPLAPPPLPPPPIAP